MKKPLIIQCSFCRKPNESLLSTNYGRLRCVHCGKISMYYFYNYPNYACYDDQKNLFICDNCNTIFYEDKSSLMKSCPKCGRTLAAQTLLISDPKIVEGQPVGTFKAAAEAANSKRAAASGQGRTPGGTEKSDTAKTIERIAGKQIAKSMVRTAPKIVEGIMKAILR